MTGYGSEARMDMEVVVTGADNATGLLTARALMDCATHITGIATDCSAPCCHSRVWNRIIAVESLPQIFDALIALGKSSGTRRVLFAAQDMVVKMVSENREALAPYYQFVLPEREVVDILLDKGRFHHWALAHGFSVPESSVVTTRVGFNAVLERGRFPMIIKPVVKNEVWDKHGSESKVFMIPNKRAYDRGGVDLLDWSPELLVQQWIPGGDEEIWFCLVYMGRDGQVKGCYTGRKILQFPVGRGNTAAAVGEKNDAVIALTEMIFRRVGFYGLGSLEFKRDPLDGNYYIIEPTVGRNDYQSGLALAGGVNLTVLAFADALGRPMGDLGRYRCVGWIDGEGALRALWGQIKRGRAPWRLYAAMFYRPIAWSLLRVRDPFPFMVWMKKKMHYIRRNFGAIVRRRLNIRYF